MTGTEIVPTPDEVLENNRTEIENTDSKSDALEAIKPVLLVCAMYDQVNGNEPLPAGGPYALELAEITPLTVAEIREEIKEMTRELLEEEDNE